MKRLLTTVLAVVAGTLTWTWIANAEGNGAPGPAGNPNHVRRPPMLAEMDANKDGQISFDEFKAFHEKRLQERFKTLDTNGDGVLTKDDRPQRPGNSEGQGQGRHRGSRSNGSAPGTGEQVAAPKA